MGTLQEAMERAGLLFYKNRFGDTATYELWDIAEYIPDDWTKRCGLCGKQLDSFHKVMWTAPTAEEKTQFYICDLCFVHGRKHNPKDFPPLTEEPRGRPSMRDVQQDAQVQEKRRTS